MKECFYDKKARPFPIAVFALGIVTALLVFILRLNMLCVIDLAFCMAVSVLMFIGALAKKRVSRWMFLGFVAAFSAEVLYYIIFGADAGFGAFTSGLAGFSSAEHPLLTGEGNFFTRLAGNLLLSLPVTLTAVCLLLCAKKTSAKKLSSRIAGSCLSLLLTGVTVFYLLTGNLRSQPNTQRLWDGQEAYLDGIDKTASKDSPNVLFILMDDLGWGDISLNGALIDTPNIDSIGKNGLSFENFYSSYSVCSPARFAAMTGRYPYRGYADNVIYPTVNCFSPFAATRLYNSFEMGANCDGMLGDEITIAEVLKKAGYNTGCFGKWHLGDYGEYLPTNQGFDVFYGSHYVNDMTPFYHVDEEDGQYTIAHGTDELKDQSKATQWINEKMTDWITDVSQSSDEPFFACYTCPWPHAPVYAGDDFDGKSGLGTYGDCVEEVDYYLGQLFDKLDELGELDNTIIVFTSDNGPALEGSTAELRGGKYLAYEGGQKVPFLLRWDDGDIAKGGTREQSATLADLFPTLISMCGVTSGGQKDVLPSDRKIDGVSMLPLIEDDTVIHDESVPILHMKREDIKAIQYTVPTADVLAMPEYAGLDYPVLTQNKYITFKYFDRIQNDNSAFFDKFRVNWLHILNDDSGENYNRAGVYPTIAAKMHEELDGIQKDFENNRRGTTAD